MTYTYPELTRQLQFPSNLDEYLRMVNIKRYYLETGYWRILPVYRYACCPFCGQIYKEKANTFELRDWGHQGLITTLYSIGSTSGQIRLLLAIIGCTRQKGSV